jgi:DnaJ-class molecular chaperone
MLTYYLTLGLTPDADDETIRRRYLERVKRYTPETDPETFQHITEAYEALKDPRLRVRGWLFGPLMVKESDTALLNLAHARTRCPERRRVGLSELAAAAEKDRGK